MYNKVIENHLKKSLIKMQPKELREACFYATEGGKKLRSNLLIYSYLSFKKELSVKVLNYAVALEMIHAYSLIHDDLPSMDDDDFRRGKPSVHRMFGEAIAILTGDALLNCAYEIMLKKPNVNAMKIISKAAGARGMIAGQTADILEKNDFHYINSKKTAALFYASFYAGAVLAGETRKARKLATAGFLFGLYYQLKDDIEDFEVKTNTNPDDILKKCLRHIKDLNINDDLFAYIKKISV